MSARIERIPQPLIELRNVGILRDIDLYLAEALARRLTTEPPALHALLAICLANRIVSDSHICLNLTDLSEEWLLSLSPNEDLRADALPHEVRVCLQQLQASPLHNHLSALIGTPESDAPFVYQQDRLYLRRYWIYEKTVADKLKTMCQAAPPPASQACPEDLQLTPQQRLAVTRALRSRLTVISGGPGTGKTYTAARMLYLLSKTNAQQQPPVIRMAAPTGKAADRLNESVQQALQGLPAVPAMEPACTIDRLLGYQSGSPYFRHDHANHLPADIVLIDEASMVDLPKMAKLLDALPNHARLILLGDMHQLASVAPGSVLGDICASNTLADCLVELTESRRFPAGGCIDSLSRTIHAATTPDDAANAWNLVKELAQGSTDKTSLSLHETPNLLTDHNGRIHNAFAQAILLGYHAFCEADSPEDAFAALARFRVLCAMRHGPHGMLTVNQIIEQILAGMSIHTDNLPTHLRTWKRIRKTGEFYDHRPIMITRNDYALNLFNGDIGVILPNPDTPDQLSACFPAKTPDTPCRRLACRLLPEHETAFATTVHKSQGSEFENILVLLPTHPSPVVTKELIYTAITRTRNSISLWSRQNAFLQAVQTRTSRTSGLPQQLDTP